MYLSNSDLSTCPNPYYKQNQCPQFVQNYCPPVVCQQQIIPQIIYVPQPYPIEYQQQFPPSTQLQYNWTPSNVYNMRWPIRR